MYNQCGYNYFIFSVEPHTKQPMSGKNIMSNTRQPQKLSKVAHFTMSPLIKWYEAHQVNCCINAFLTEELQSGITILKSIFVPHNLLKKCPTFRSNFSILCQRLLSLYIGPRTYRTTFVASSAELSVVSQVGKAKHR